MLTNGESRVVWAVNPFTDQLSALRSSVDALVEYAGRVNAEVIPICVWKTVGDGEHSTEIDPNELNQYWESGRQVVRELLASRNLRARPLQILASSYITLRDAVSDLLRYAERQQAELIVLSTHGRKGPRRWLLGSFAETLSTIADIPLLIVPWKKPVHRRTGAVLFATDFSEESFRAYEQLVDQAKVYRWSITLFHHMTYYYPVFDYAFIPPEAYRFALGGDATARKQDMRALIEYARQNGVRARSHVDNSFSGGAADVILRYAKKGFDLIALASRSGAMKGAMLGSTARRVIRESSLPVWVIHPPKVRRAKKEKARTDRRPGQIARNIRLSRVGREDRLRG